MFNLQKIQAALAVLHLEGWLLYDFRGSNPLARRVLGINPSAHTSRRWFYFIPANGKPRKLVHRIESGVLDHLPGDKMIYLSWQELEHGVASLMNGVDGVAMEYSPRNAIPYISRVDAGTIELVRAQDTEIVSSGDLVQQFEAVWSEDQWQMHQQAAAIVLAGYEKAWAFLAEKTAGGGTVHEADVQDLIMQHFADNHLETDHPPIVGANAHAGDPHYAPSREKEGTIRAGDLVLIDSWAKLDQPNAVYADFTRMGFLGAEVPEKFAKVFSIIARARDAGISFVQEAFKTNRPIRGWQVDKTVRDVIQSAGYGDKFIHRTGHSIGDATHGNGANMDNLETHDERIVMRGTCFSIEPGIYLPEFGVRTEINVYIDLAGGVHITGQPQKEILAVT